MWITLVFMILVGAVGWVFGFTNLSAAQKVKEHDDILMELKEDRGTVSNELKNINRRLDRIERLIEANIKIGGTTEKFVPNINIRKWG